MKFGETFMEYLHGDQERILDKCSHVEYKRLKKVLKRCRTCKATLALGQDERDNDNTSLSRRCPHEACALCGQVFFSELMKEASDISVFFSSGVRNLLHLHIANGMQRYVQWLRQCFKNDHEIMVQQSQILTQYVTMNAIAMRKILKKYDKVHCSVSGRNFKAKLHAEHLELLQSPWVIELGAFYMNLGEADGERDGVISQFSCNLNLEQPVMTLTLPDSRKLDYDLTCAICLDVVFNPHALECGHLFCKACVCSAASLMIFEGLKFANPDTKCPVCREAGVYTNAVRMLELDLLLKKRCNEYWKERRMEERAEMVKQSKEYWDLQTKYAIGY